jgi:pilus assembly protein CpaE
MSSTVKKESSAAGKQPFLAFAANSADIEALKAFASSQDWPENSVHQGDINHATEYLKNHPSPGLLLVELPSADDANVMLDALADVCDPETRVITIGDINEYSFYCWLTEIGITSYLLKPLTQEMLESAYHKVMTGSTTAGGRDKPPAKVVAVMGTRGGVGATTVALNLGGIMASATKKNIALVDIDPQQGSIALSLDIEPSRSLRDALERPDRIDSLFIERVMNKPLPNLSVLSAEESLLEHIKVQENAGELLLKELKEKFDYVVLDIPRHLNGYARQCLKRADYVVLVTELTLLSLRDALRVSDLMREAFHMHQPVVVANKLGHAAKHEMKPLDFEKGINNTVSHSIPYAPDVFMPISNEFAAIHAKGNAAVKPLYDLAGHIVPAIKKTISPDKKGFHLFGGKKGA